MGEPNPATPARYRPNGNGNGSRILTIVLMLVFTVILTVVGYRRCGSRAAAWYLIRFSKGRRRQTGEDDEEGEASCLTSNLPETDIYGNCSLTQTIINEPATESPGQREKSGMEGDSVKSKTRRTTVQPKAKLWKSSLTSTLSKSKTGSSNEMTTPLWSEGGNEENENEEDGQEQEQNTGGRRWSMQRNNHHNSNGNHFNGRTFTEL